MLLLRRTLPDQCSGRKRYGLFSVNNGIARMNQIAREFE
jgi:hypothetical protein